MHLDMASGESSTSSEKLEAGSPESPAVLEIGIPLLKEANDDTGEDSDVVVVVAAATAAENNNNNCYGDGLLGRFSKNLDLFLSPDGKRLPRVPMVANLAQMVPPTAAAAIAVAVVNGVFGDPCCSRVGYRTKLATRLGVVAAVYLGSAARVLCARRIPSGAALAAGGVHAFLMNRDVGPPGWPAFSTAWAVASLWAAGAGIYLFRNRRHNRTTSTDGDADSFGRGVAVWSLYANLACLSLPNVAGFGLGRHDPALLARSALLVSGHMLGHPVFRLFGWAAVANMVVAFLFPGDAPLGEQLSENYHEGIRSSFWVV